MLRTFILLQNYVGTEFEDKLKILALLSGIIGIYGILYITSERVTRKNIEYKAEKEALAYLKQKQYYDVMLEKD